ncbi:MAG: RraA family protein [Dehalococcoidia bacterium]
MPSADTTPPPGPPLASAYVSDVLDALGVSGRVLNIPVTPLRTEWRAVGRAFPLQVSAAGLDDSGRRNAGLVRAIDAIPPGALVLIEASSVDCAPFGSITARRAIARGAIGVVSTGAVRDAESLRQFSMPVFSARRTPIRAMGRADVVSFDTPMIVAGVDVRPGELVVADGDGVVVVPRDCEAEVLRRVAELHEREGRLMTALAGGYSLSELFSAPPASGSTPVSDL